LNFDHTIAITYKGGLTLEQNILCEVNNCHFWKNGNHCGAEEIYVVSHSGKHAASSYETDCKTFKPTEA